MISTRQVMAELEDDYPTLRIVFHNDPLAHKLQEQFTIPKGDNTRERVLVELTWRLFRARWSAAGGKL